MKTPKPSFQQSSNPNRFRERVAQDKKSSSPQFKTKPRGFAKSRPAPVKTVPTQTQTEMELHSANGASKVKVMVKKTENKPSYVKKTGALSPRAPEKIKKNRAEEMKVYGEKACLALFKQRPDSIIRAWATVEMAHKIGDIFSYLAANKKAYHVVSSQELAKASGSEHNGGLCFLVKKPRTFTLNGYLGIPHQQDALVLLNGVQNAYNLGGIVRSCAIFGISGLICEDVNALFTPATMRIAEGGMEFIRPLATPTVAQALAELRANGYQVMHLAPNKSSKGLSKKLTFAAKAVFVLSENASLCEGLFEQGDVMVQLTPNNPLQSELNISVSTGILLSQWFQR